MWEGETRGMEDVRKREVEGVIVGGERKEEEREWEVERVMVGGGRGRKRSTELGEQEQ